MKFKSLIFSSFLFLTALFAFTSNAFAEGFDARVALGADLLMIKNTYSSSRLDFNGVTAKLAFGYDFGHWGVYLEQNLGGFTDYEMSDEEDRPRQIQGEADHFFGGTYAVVKGIFPISQQFKIDAGIGLGVMYASGDKEDMAKEHNSKSYAGPIIYNTDYENSPAFAFRFSVSFTYFLTEMIGVGLYIDYNLGLKSFGNDTVEYHIYHDVDPGAQLVLKF